MQSFLTLNRLLYHRPLYDNAILTKREVSCCSVEQTEQHQVPVDECESCNELPGFCCRVDKTVPLMLSPYQLHQFMLLLWSFESINKKEFYYQCQLYSATATVKINDTEHTLTTSMSPEVHNEKRSLLQKVNCGALKTGGTKNLWGNRDVDLRTSHMESKSSLNKFSFGRQNKRH
jgi:hypothetical protein